MLSLVVVELRGELLVANLLIMKQLLQLLEIPPVEGKQHKHNCQPHKTVSPCRFTYSNPPPQLLVHLAVDNIHAHTQWDQMGMDARNERILNKSLL